MKQVLKKFSPFLEALGYSHDVNEYGDNFFYNVAGECRCQFFFRTKRGSTFAVKGCIRVALSGESKRPFSIGGFFEDLDARHDGREEWDRWPKKISDEDFVQLKSQIIEFDKKFLTQYIHLADDLKNKSPSEVLGDFEGAYGPAKSDYFMDFGKMCLEMGCLDQAKKFFSDGLLMDDLEEYGTAKKNFMVKKLKELEGE